MIHARSSLEPYSNIEPWQIPALPPKVRIVDVREPQEWVGELGHLTNADLVPLAILAQKASSWNRDEPLLVVCRSGGRSAQAASWLCAAGFSNVTNLAGGMIAYNAAGLPVVKE